MKFIVSDDSSAIFAENISNSRKKYSVKIGDKVRLTIKKSRYGRFKKKQGALAFGVVIRTKKIVNRSNSNIKFLDNAVILVNNFTELKPIGKNINGKIGIEILQNYSKFEEIIRITDIKQFV